MRKMQVPTFKAMPIAFAQRWLQMAVGVACFSLITGVLLISWLPSPRLKEQVPMPAKLAVWADAEANENSRTAVPFLLLGIAWGTGLVAGDARRHRSLVAWVSMVGVAGVAEAGQLLIPARCCDPGDIGWAAVGAAAGLVAVRFVVGINGICGLLQFKQRGASNLSTCPGHEQKI